MHFETRNLPGHVAQLGLNDVSRVNVASPLPEPAALQTNNLIGQFGHPGVVNGIRAQAAPSLPRETPERSNPNGCFGLPEVGDTLVMRGTPPLTVMTRMPMSTSSLVLATEGGVNIRQQEKKDIQRHILTGSILQVAGPPMAGKSTTVMQAVQDLQDSPTLKIPIIRHPINCKGCKSVHEVIESLLRTVDPSYHGEVANNTHPHPNLRHSCFTRLYEILHFTKKYHHVFIFHKVEQLRVAPHDHDFLNFLYAMVQELSHLCTVNVVFTSYRKFPSQVLMGLLEMDVLTDPMDVLSIMHHYAPGVEALDYVHVCLKSLCLPAAVRRLAENYVSDPAYRLPPEEVEEKIQDDVFFLHDCFAHRSPEVPEWVGDFVMKALIHFCQGLGHSFTEKHLRETVGSEGWKQLLQHLSENYIVRREAVVERLCVHPLLVYYYRVCLRHGLLALRGHWYDHSCNRFSQFMSTLLQNIDANYRLHGQRGMVYGYVLHERPHIQHLLQMALHCNNNTYANFMRVAVAAWSPILKFFPREARPFYESLYHGACEVGTPEERAVLGAFYGLTLTFGQGSMEPGGSHWPEAERQLETAITELRPRGVSFYLVWAIAQRAIIMYRQGKYNLSLRDMRQALELCPRMNRRALGPDFAVSELKQEELTIKMQIYKTIPQVFLGSNLEARAKLESILSTITERCENHPDLAILLNTIGLTWQRGDNNMQQAVRWYRLSLTERLYMERFCPLDLVVPLNNLASPLLGEGKADESLALLEKALKIQRKEGWLKYNTALTHIHRCEVHIKCHKFAQALTDALEADRILEKTAKEHDLRMRIYHTLAHIRVILRQLQDPLLQEGAAAKSPSMQTSVRGPQTAAEHVVAIEATVEPKDLLCTAEDELCTVLELSRSMELSDDGHNLVLSTYEHLMLFHWDNSPDVFKNYRMSFLSHLEEHSWVKQVLDGADGWEEKSKGSVHPRLLAHRAIYKYIKEYSERMELYDFARLLCSVCATCVFTNSFFDARRWHAEACHHIQERKRKTTFGFSVLGRSNPVQVMSETDKQPRDSSICLCKSCRDKRERRRADSSSPSSCHQSTSLDYLGLPSSVTSPLVLQDQKEILQKIQSTSQTPTSVCTSVNSFSSFNLDSEQEEEVKSASGGCKFSPSLLEGEENQRQPTEQSWQPHDSTSCSSWLDQERRARKTHLEDVRSRVTLSKNHHNRRTNSHTEELELSPVHSQTHLPTHSHTHLPTHSHTHLPTHSQTHLPTHSQTHLPTHSQTHLTTHSQTHLLTHSQTHLPTHSQTHLPTHSQTHPPTHSHAQPLTFLQTQLPAHSQSQPPIHTLKKPPTHSQTHPLKDQERFSALLPPTHTENILEKTGQPPAPTPALLTETGRAVAAVTATVVAGTKDTHCATQESEEKPLLRGEGQTTEVSSSNGQTVKGLSEYVHNHQRGSGPDSAYTSARDDKMASSNASSCPSCSSQLHSEYCQSSCSCGGARPKTRTSIKGDLGKTEPQDPIKTGKGWAKHREATEDSWNDRSCFFTAGPTGDIKTDQPRSLGSNENDQTLTNLLSQEEDGQSPAEPLVPVVRSVLSPSQAGTRGAHPLIQGRYRDPVEQDEQEVCH